jgi:hypothetical protein
LISGAFNAGLFCGAPDYFFSLNYCKVSNILLFLYYFWTI